MVQATAKRVRKEPASGFEPFAYPATPAPPAPSWEAFGIAEPGDQEEKSLKPEAAEEPESTPATNPAAEAERVEQMRRSFEAGRKRGIQEGRAAEREAMTAGIKARDAERIAQAARLAERFEQERRRYMEQVEPEVVKLALAVAARILRREAQMDPLLLTGAVRVALGQLSASTQIRLKVPPAELALWTETMANLPNLAVKPTVIAGEGMRLGDCVLETELGSVDLGLRAQLGEIERGFFDRTGQNAARGDTGQ